MVTIYLRRGTARATGMDHEWPTYFEVDADDPRATHQVKLSGPELRGALRFCGPSWELRGDLHDRVEPR